VLGLAACTFPPPPTPVPAPARARAAGPPPGLPVVRGPVLVNDVGHGSPNAQYQSSGCQRVGTSVYCVYLAASTADDPDDRDLAAQYYVRRIDLETLRAVGPARRVFEPEQETTYAPVHQSPAMARDARGALIPVAAWMDLRDRRNPKSATLQCARDPKRPEGSRCWGTHHRVIPDLDDARTWLPDGGLPSRVYAASASWVLCPRAGGSRPESCGPGTHDWNWVYDARAGCAYGVGEGFRMEGLVIDGARASSGMGRVLYRICGDARDPSSFDGPHLVVDAGAWPGAALGSPPSLSAGNVFTKGHLRLGREEQGPRSLHLAWTAHNTFAIENRPGDGPCGAAGSDDDAVEWDFDLFYARSDDGGRTWSSHDGSARTRKGVPIAWNDERFRIWQGETEQTQGYAWDVDTSGHPVFALLEPRSGAWKGTKGDAARWHVDHDACNGAKGDERVVHDLHLLRWEDGRWVRRPVEPGFGYTRLGLHVALGGEIYVFAEVPPRYRVSSDGGRSFTEWTRFDDFECRDYSDRWRMCDNGWRLQVMPDYDDPRFVQVLFQSPGTRRNPSSWEVQVDGRYHYVQMQTAR
jgi:hypothetical protein